MTERQIVTKIEKMLKRDYPSFWFWKVSDKFTAGIPDIVGCLGVCGQMVGIEVKTDKGRLSRLQEYTIKRIKASGGAACVVRSVEEAKRFMEGISGA
jgi:hypothetical protein